MKFKDVVKVLSEDSLTRREIEERTKKFIHRLIDVIEQKGLILKKWWMPDYSGDMQMTFDVPYKLILPKKFHFIKGNAHVLIYARIARNEGNPELLSFKPELHLSYKSEISYSCEPENIIKCLKRLVNHFPENILFEISVNALHKEKIKSDTLHKNISMHASMTHTTEVYVYDIAPLMKAFTKKQIITYAHEMFSEVEFDWKKSKMIGVSTSSSVWD